MRSSWWVVLSLLRNPNWQLRITSRPSVPVDNLTHDREKTNGPVIFRPVAGLSGYDDHVRLLPLIWKVALAKHGIAYVCHMHDEFPGGVLESAVGNAVRSWGLVTSE
ncbi:hypothetical protein Trydic_g18732 [Trypoxylus dichotomus]